VKRTVEQYKAEQGKLKNAYQQVFKGPNAELVMKDLEAQFNRTTLRKVNGVIDPYSSIAAAGCREVLLYIDQMMETENHAVTE